MAVDEATVLHVLLTERAKILAYVWAIVHDEHLVEDLYQEVSILAVQKRSQIFNAAAVLPWVRQTARHKALHLLQNKQKGPVLLADSVLDGLDCRWQQLDQQPSAGLIDALRHCIAGLSPYARQIVALRYGRGLSGLEVAKSLQRKVHTIYMALSRIHNSLRECMQAELHREEGRHE